MDGNRLTDDWLETGLARLEEEGLSASTLHQYRGYLRLFQQFLGQTKELGPKSLAQWQQAMAQEGVYPTAALIPASRRATACCGPWGTRSGRCPNACRKSPAPVRS